VLGGLLTEGPGWRWIFLVNVPVSVAAVWLTLRVVPESRGPAGRRVDWAGTVTFAGCTAALTYGFVRAGEHGWGDAGTLTAFGAAAALLVAFVVAERVTEHPMLDLSLLRRPSFTGVMVGALAFNCAAFGVLAYVSIWGQTVLGLSPVQSGLAALPLPLVSLVVAAAGGRLLHGVAPRWTVGGGLLLIGAGGFCQAVLDAGSGWESLVVGLVLTGVGTGLVAPAVSGAALAAVPQDRAGMAGGAVNTVRQLGYALGVAAYGTVLTARMQHTVPAGAAHALAGGGAAALRGVLPVRVLRAAFASGLDAAELTAGATGLVAGLLVFLLVRPEPKGAAVRASSDTAPAGDTEAAPART
jgi:predicted MFS family arabinose efflux permease